MSVKFRNGLKLLYALLVTPLYYLQEICYFIFRTRPRKEIKGKHVLITGSAEGMGAEYALRFAEMGNTVHCVDINGALNKETVEGLKAQGYPAYGYTCDLTKWDEIEAVYNQITEKGFIITYLVNNAGLLFCSTLDDLTPTQIEKSIHVNLITPIWLCKLFLPKMKEINEGHIVNMASLAGYFAMVNGSEYCAGKAGVIHLSNQLRFELINTAIKFSVVCPFFVRTRMIKGIEDSIPCSFADYMLGVKRVAGEGKSSSMFILEPKELVDIAIIGIREEKEVIIPNVCFKLFKLADGWLPRPYSKALQKIVSDRDSSYLNKDVFVGQNLIKKIA